MSGRPLSLNQEQLELVCEALKTRRRLMRELREYTAKFIGARLGVSRDVVYRVDKRLHGSQSGITQNVTRNETELVT